MGLFKSKEEKQLLKQQKAENKDSLKSELETFKKNNDLAVNDFYFNDSLNRFLIKKNILINTKQTSHDYSDLVSYTPIFQEGSKRKHHGITRAIVGGVVAGPVGALVGSGTGGKQIETIKQLGFMLQFKNNQTIKYMLITSETKMDSLVGKTLMDVYNKLASKFDQIINLNNQTVNISITNSTSLVEQIKEFKELLDNNIITQEEFDLKKKELLNL